MNEWSVVLVIATLLGVIGTVGAPIIKLNSTITKLTTVMDVVKTDMSELTDKNSKNHDRLWEKNGQQDATLVDHETRITIIEKTEHK